MTEDYILKTYASRYAPVGSRVTCDPAPKNTDRDILVLLRSYIDFHSFSAALLFDWTASGSDVFDPKDPDNWDFTSYRRGEVNLIVTKKAEFYDRFLAATSVAKRLNLLRKSDRIDLFQAVLYGNSCE